MTPKQPRLPDDARSASAKIPPPAPVPAEDAEPRTGSTGAKPAPRSAMPRTPRPRPAESDEVFDLDNAPADFDRTVKQPRGPMSKDGLPAVEGPRYRGWPIPMRGVWEAIGPLMLMAALASVPVAILGFFGAFGAMSQGSVMGLAGINFSSGLGGHIDFSLPESAGLPQTSGTFTWLPLMGALILLRFGFSAGMRLWHSAEKETDYAVSSLSYALLMGAAGGIIAVVSRQSFGGADPFTSVLVPVGWSLLGLLLGGVSGAGGPVKFVRAERWLSSKGQWWRWAADYLSALFRSVGVTLLGLLALGALLLGGSLIWHWSDFIAAAESVSGSPAAFLGVAWVQMAYLPNFLVFALAWATGAGVGFGENTLASPVGTTLGALPPMPLLTAFPADVPAWGWAVLLLPVLCAVAGGWWFYREGEDHLLEYLELRLGPGALARGLSVALNALAAGVMVGAALAVCSAAAGGSLGLGRFTRIGSDIFSVWWMGAAEAALGTALGLLAAPFIERD